MEDSVMTQGTPIHADLDDEARRLLSEVQRRDLDARLIGGMAVRILAGERLHPAYDRQVQDLDFVLTRKHAREAERLLAEAGYVPEEMFNALNGHRRLLFHDEHHGRQIDVFVDTFEMCHTLPLAERLGTRPQTLPAAEVLMTKLQIVHLNAKDRGDLYALLHSHEVAEHDDDAVNAARIAELTSNDWGLQRTFELNLARLREGLGEQPLEAEDLRAVAQRIDHLAAAMEQAPKSRKWKLRAKVGERKRWYEEPEEVDREG
jgi:hypothetical protein